MCNLVQRNENECALGQSGVGNLKRSPADYEIVKEKNIHVESARAVLKIENAIPPEVLFDEQQSAQQLERCQIGFQRRDRVEKARLIGKSHWGSGVERRQCDHAA